MATNIKEVPAIPEGYNLTGKVFMIHDVDAPSSEDTKRIPASFFLPTLYLEKTYAEAAALIASNSVTPGVLYKITDRGDLGIFLEGVATNAFSRTGLRQMLCPAFYGSGANGGNDWIGVWNNTKSVSIDELTIWGGLVWRNTSGSIGTSVDDYELSGSDWVLVPKSGFENGEYVALTFGVLYDIANDWIERQWDGAGNELGCNKFMADYNGITVNPVDVSDWNMSTGDFPFFGNRVLSVSNNSNAGGIYNNTGGPVTGNSNSSEIDDNYTLWGIIGNTNDGYIQFNRCADISGNSNIGDINGNIVSESLSYNSNNGRIVNNIGPTQISGNFSPVKDIKENTCSTIGNNTNDGDISFNKNTGEINGNTVVGDIILNHNNGYILKNISSVPVSIHNNFNNGNIGSDVTDTVRTEDVTDTILNK